MSTLTAPVDPARDHIQGPDDAPVTLVEYGDYECPYCGEAFPIVQRLQAEFGDQLRFVFRNFPLGEIHPHAQHAAEAAEAAGEQGKFWEMHDTLYRHQRALEHTDLKNYADQLGLDGRELLAAVGSGAFAERVRADFLSGIRSGVNGTPTFFINGVRHDQSFEFEVLLEALEDAMDGGEGDDA